MKFIKIMLIVIGIFTLIAGFDTLEWIKLPNGSDHFFRKSMFYFFPLCLCLIMLAVAVFFNWKIFGVIVGSLSLIFCLYVLNDYAWTPISQFVSDKSKSKSPYDRFCESKAEDGLIATIRQDLMGEWMSLDSTCTYSITSDYIKSHCGDIPDLKYYIWDEWQIYLTEDTLVTLNPHFLYEQYKKSGDPFTRYSFGIADSVGHQILYIDSLELIKIE